MCRWMAGVRLRLKLVESPACRDKCPISAIIQIALKRLACPIVKRLDGLALRLVNFLLNGSTLITASANVLKFPVSQRSTIGTIFSDVFFVERIAATFANSNHDVASVKAMWNLK